MDAEIEVVKEEEETTNKRDHGLRDPEGIVEDEVIGEEVIAEDVVVIEEDEEVTVVVEEDEEATSRLKLESWRKSTKPQILKFFPICIVSIPFLVR